MMISDTNERGKLKWKVFWTGIRGGVIQAHISKNRISFQKKFIFKDDESFNTAIKILKERTFQILHYKDYDNPEVCRLAQYALESTSVEPIKD